MPVSSRDLSFSIKDFSSRKNLEKYILEYENELIKEKFIFDYFYNEKSAEIKIGFRFIFQSQNSTITETEVNNVMNEIIRHTEKIKGVTIPGYSRFFGLFINREFINYEDDKTINIIFHINHSSHSQDFDQEFWIVYQMT